MSVTCLPKATGAQPRRVVVASRQAMRRWRGRLIRVGLALLLGVPMLGLAAPATYSGEAPVSSQAEAERAGALKSALAEVVMRISGDAGILARADVASAVAEADKYMLQFRYRSEDKYDAVSDATRQQLFLVAEFDRAAVDRMLAGLGLGSAAASAEPVQKRVWISGIESADDYARCMGFLARQPLLRKAWPLQSRGDGMLVQLVLGTDLQRWLDSLGVDAVLAVNNGSPPLDGIDATLVLRH